MIKFNNLAIYLEKKEILKNINIDIKPGINILLGNNGSGKSVFLQTIAGFSWFFDKILQKKVRIRGKYFIKNFSYPDIENISYLLKELGIVLQEKNLICNVPTSQLENFHNLSWGRKKFIELMGLLGSDYNYILLDEPLSFLDIDNKNKVIEKLKVLSKEKVILIVEHNLEDFKKLNNISFWKIENLQIVPYTNFVNWNNEVCEKYINLERILEVINFKPQKVILIIKELKIPYTSRVLKNYVFTSGDVVFVTGKNGSGKTLFLKTLVGIKKTKPRKVQCVVNGKEASLEDYNNAIYIPQNTNYISFNKFSYIFKKLNIDLTKINRNKIEDFLGFNMDKNTYSLSGGQKKWGWLTLAFFKQPFIILLDEPEVFLDSCRRHILIQLISLTKVTQCCVLFIVTHNLSMYSKYLNLNEYKIIKF